MSNTTTNIIQAHVPCLILYISVLEIAYHSVYYRVLLMVKGNTADKVKERLCLCPCCTFISVPHCIQTGENRNHEKY